MSSAAKGQQNHQGRKFAGQTQQIDRKNAPESVQIESCRYVDQSGSPFRQLLICLGLLIFAKIRDKIITASWPSVFPRSIWTKLSWWRPIHQRTGYAGCWGSCVSFAQLGRWLLFCSFWPKAEQAAWCPLEPAWWRWLLWWLSALELVRCLFRWFWAQTPSVAFTNANF